MTFYRDYLPLLSRFDAYTETLVDSKKKVEKDSFFSNAPKLRLSGYSSDQKQAALVLAYFNKKVYTDNITPVGLDKLSENLLGWVDSDNRFKELIKNDITNAIEVRNTLMKLRDQVKAIPRGQYTDLERIVDNVYACSMSDLRTNPHTAIEMNKNIKAFLLLIEACYKEKHLFNDGWIYLSSKQEPLRNAFTEFRDYLPNAHGAMNPRGLASAAKYKKIAGAFALASILFLSLTILLATCPLPLFAIGGGLLLLSSIVSLVKCMHRSSQLKKISTRINSVTYMNCFTGFFKNDEPPENRPRSIKGGSHHMKKK